MIALLALLALPAAAQPVADLSSCAAAPIPVYAANDASLRDMARAKGQRLVVEADLADRAKVPLDSYVWAADYSTFALLEVDAKLAAARLPMTRGAWRAGGYNDAPAASLLDQRKFDRAVARLAALEGKRRAGRLTPAEKGSFVKDAIGDVLRDDADLKPLLAVVAVGPRKAIPYFGFNAPAALEEGYGDDADNVVVAVPIDSRELKRRVQESMAAEEFMNKTIGELTDSHVMSEAGMILLGLAEAAGGDSLLGAEERAKLIESFLGYLPDCRRP